MHPRANAQKIERSAIAARLAALFKNAPARGIILGRATKVWHRYESGSAREKADFRTLDITPLSELRLTSSFDELKAHWPLTAWANGFAASLR